MAFFSNSKYVGKNRYFNIIMLNRKKFRSQTVNNMDRWKSNKAEVGRVREQKESDRNKVKVREKVKKSCNCVFFPMFWRSGGSKSRLAKAAGAEPFGQMRNEKLHPVVARSPQPWREAPFRAKMVGILRRSSEHVWKLRCWESARFCGARHISKLKFEKLVAGNTCRSENSKNIHVHAAFGRWNIQKTHETFRNQNAKIAIRSDHFWSLNHTTIPMNRITIIITPTLKIITLTTAPTPPPPPTIILSLIIAYE